MIFLFRMITISLLLMVTPMMIAGESVYPEGHFDGDRMERVTDYGLFLDYMNEKLAQSKTVFVRWVPSETGCDECMEQAPAWNQATRLFLENTKDPKVAFAEVNLADVPMLRGTEMGEPGKRGWPTIRYFNKETGQFGADYKKVTSLPIHRELGDLMRMMDYIEDYGNTALCHLDTTNCNEKEINYLNKWKVKSKDDLQSQYKRLEDMTTKKMKEDLLEWTWRRMRILKRLLAVKKDPETSAEL